MPKLRNDDEAPRRCRATAAVAEADERGVLMRLLLSSPKDVVAALLASAAVVAIVSNAIFMQAGHHPSPMFGRAVSPSVSVITLPRPRPVDAETRPDARALDQKLLEPTVTELKPAEPKPAAHAAEVRPVETRSTADVRHPEPRPAVASAARARSADAEAGDPLGHLVRSTVPQAASLPAAGSAAVPRPPAAIPSMAQNAPGGMSASARRVAAVQRALTQYGYGQLKPTGTVGSDTQAAIQRFERARRLPVTGQVSDRLVRELGTVIGRPIE